MVRQTPEQIAQREAWKARLAELADLIDKAYEERDRANEKLNALRAEQRVLNAKVFHA